MTQFTFTRTYNNVTPLPYDGFYYDNLANTFTLWVETPQVFYNYLEEPDMGIIITSQDAAVNIQVVLKASQFSLLNDQVGQWVITAAAQYYVGGAVVGSNPLVVGTPYYVSFELGDGDLSHLVPSGGPPFLDSTFSIENAADNTKVFDVDVSNVPTGTTVTLEIPPANGTFPSSPETGSLIAGFLNFSSMTGTNNTSYGINALQADTTGSENVAVGSSALGANTTGNDNTAVGCFTMADANCSNSVAVGASALLGDMGGQNVAVGVNAGANVSTGNTNTLVGYLAGNDLTTGFDNLCLGSNCLAGSATALNRIVLGMGSGTHDQSFHLPDSVGFYIPNLASSVQTNVLAFNTVGGGVTYMPAPTQSSVFLDGSFEIENTADNTKIFKVDVSNVTTATTSTLLIPQSVSNQTTLVMRNGTNSSLQCGNLSSTSSGSDCTSYGVDALSDNTTGTNNTAIGFSALNNADGASNATAVGANCLGAYVGTALDGGATAIGANALGAYTGPDAATAVGINALAMCTSGANTAMGTGALSQCTTGTFNAAFGEQSLSDCTGQQNTAVGYQSGVILTSGIENTYVGWSTGGSDTIASSNTFVGANAGYGNVGQGSSCVAIGNNTLINSNQSTLVGTGASDGGYNEVICLGSGATALNSNRLVLSNMNTTASATGGSDVIPTLASLFLSIQVNGVDYKVALFNP
jgi:hypothetical protein